MNKLIGIQSFLLFMFFLCGCGDGFYLTGEDDADENGCSNIVGASCGGGLYAGELSSQKLIVTPGGCNDSATPVCPGTTDTLNKIYSSDFNNIVAASSNTDGASNTTAVIASDGVNAEAATYCENMVYGGHSDWYLPARDELQLLYDNRIAIGGFELASNDCYWSSTNEDASTAKGIVFNGGGYAEETKDYTGTWVRCIRKL